ncbi:FIG00450916: hypothetical protein [hydrothermal vent metagenome]|uniref:Uncharacterized protein n=1 Tax=hydrothermal vent metagenome TaxID=652676 RepID=A0A3B0UI68_9ZZZZ
MVVCFLWHFPWGHPRRALPGTVFLWSPDFPPLFQKRKEAATRSTGQVILNLFSAKTNIFREMIFKILQRIRWQNTIVPKGPLKKV